MFSYKNIKDDKCFEDLMPEDEDPNAFISGEEYFIVKEMEVYTMENPINLKSLKRRVQALESIPTHAGVKYSKILTKADVNFLQ